MQSVDIVRTPTGVGRQMIKTRLPQPRTDGKPGSKTPEERAALDARARAVIQRYANYPGAISLDQAKLMQRTMACAACGGKLFIESDTDSVGRLFCLACTRTVKEVRLDTTCQVGQN